MWEIVVLFLGAVSCGPAPKLRPLVGFHAKLLSTLAIRLSIGDTEALSRADCCSSF